LRIVLPLPLVCFALLGKSFHLRIYVLNFKNFALKQALIKESAPTRTGSVANSSSFGMPVK
jgi:hypothetical protein